jgi:hypothetical protein
MKKLILLLLFIPLLSFGQTTPIKVQVTKQPSFSQGFNQGLQNSATFSAISAANRNAQAADANARTAALFAQSQALNNNYENISIDLIKGNSSKFKNIVIKKVSGWSVAANFAEILEQINGTKIYKLVSSNDLQIYIDKNGYVATKEITNKKGVMEIIKIIDEGKIYEPVFPLEYLNDTETLFLEWHREAISQYDRLTRLVLKNSSGEIVYKAEYKNKGYIEMLRPVNSNYIYGKQDAKKQLIELKEYLDLGIITQEEFNTKAVSLKKILLGN